MRTRQVAALFATLAAAAAASLTSATATHAEQTAGYIVVLRGDANSPSIASEHTRTRGAAVDHVYRSSLNGTRRA